MSWCRQNAQHRARRSEPAGDSPLQLPWTVEALHEGNFAATGPFYRGMKMRPGRRPACAIRVCVVVATYKTQLADQAMYRYVGIEPMEQAILVNKELGALHAPISRR